MKKAMIILFGFACLFCLSGWHAETSQAQHPVAPAIPILLYHSIAEDSDELAVSPSRFEEQMRYLRDRGYHPLKFADLKGWEKGRLPPKPVVVTMDDGYENQYTAAFPILRLTGMKATIFAVTGDIGKTDRLTWGQLREMETSGLVDMQSHTVTHPDLTKLNPAEKAQELKESRGAIHPHPPHFP